MHVASYKHTHIFATNVKRGNLLFVPFELNAVCVRAYVRQQQQNVYCFQTNKCEPIVVV